MADVFNNPSNDYIRPGLSPCSGTGDDGYFEFVDDGAGVTIGSEINAFMNLSDIKIPVTEWSKESKTIQSGEVIYVSGISKGLRYKTNVYDITGAAYEGATSKYFYIVDLSICYYNNFRLYNASIDASSNYANSISIDDALSTNFAANGITVDASIDPSTLSFTGTVLGYDFDITNVELTLIDASLDSDSPFPSIIDASGNRIPQTYTLEEDASGAIPFATYPNGAMLGYMLKNTYPSTADVYDSWIYINHVDSPFDVYEPIIIDNYIADVSQYKSLSFDPSIIWGPFIPDPSSADYLDTSINNTAVTDVSILRSYINNDSSVTDSTIENSWVNAYEVVTGLWTNDVSTTRINISGGIIHDTSLNNVLVTDASIYTSNIYDSSLVGCTIYNTIIDDNSELVDSLNTYINATLDASLTYDFDSSTYYQKFSKTVDVGRSIAGTDKILSAGEYLDYINTNNLWSKVGVLSSRFSAPDNPNAYTKNLVKGFYVFNPQLFPVKIEYMVLNYEE